MGLYSHYTTKVVKRASPRKKIKIKNKNTEAVRELNPRPLAPGARIIPLDQRPSISQ